MVSIRAVAFIDILGFRDKLYSLGTSRLAEEYENVMMQISALNHPKADLSDNIPTLFSHLKKNDEYCIQHIFSDSIICIAHDESEMSFLQLLVYTWRITQGLLAFKMHPRGAIAFGEMYANRKSNIFLGKALTEAYELERQQDWIGIALSESTSKHYDDLISILSPDSNPTILYRYDVPMKENIRKTLHAINWRWNLVVKDGTESLLPVSSDKSVIKKNNNTIEFVKKIVEGGKLYVSNQEKLPAELRTFWIGDTEPPFKHGDNL